MLLKIVEAEAGCEDTEGRMLVANVVMNRVRNGYFPNTVTEVVYQRQDGTAQFSPVSDGRIDTVNVSQGTIDAVARVMNGEDISQQKEYIRQRKIGRVYQNPAMGTCPSMTILENMSLADNKGKKFGLGFGTNKKRVDYYRELLSQLGLGLEDMMGSKVGSLSGGQRQAMALLMTTMAPIEILILDEHTAALDPKTAELIMELTGKVVKEKKLTTIMVTHNLRYAVEYGNRILMMHQGHAVLDKAGEEKAKLVVDDLLDHQVKSS